MGMNEDWAAWQQSAPKYTGPVGAGGVATPANEDERTAGLKHQAAFYDTYTQYQPSNMMLNPYIKQWNGSTQQYETASNAVDWGNANGPTVVTPYRAPTPQSATEAAAGIVVGGVPTGTPNMNTYNAANPNQQYAVGSTPAGVTPKPAAPAAPAAPAPTGMLPGVSSTIPTAPGQAAGGTNLSGVTTATGEPAGGALPDRFKPAAAVAQTREVDRPTETVQGQLQGMLAAGSPLISQAEQRAQEAAAARGLGNSSIAAGAGRAAAYDVALRIAEADANIFNAKSAANQANRQQAEISNVAAMNNFVGAQLQAELALTSQQQAARDDIAKLMVAGEIDRAKIVLDKQLTADITNADNNTKLLLQGNASAQQVLATTQQNINAIWMNEKLDPANKQKAIDNQVAGMRASLAIIGAMAGDVDLTSLLDSVLPQGSIGPNAAATGTTRAPTTPVAGGTQTGIATGGNIQIGTIDGGGA